MEQILHATQEDIPAILALMNGAICDDVQRDWYVTDDENFVRRHVGVRQKGQDVSGNFEKNIGPEGYTLKYVVDGGIVAFLLVRYPGDAEDNLGRYLINCSRVFAGREFVAEVMETKSARPEQEIGEVIVLSLVTHMESAAVHSDYRGRGLQGKLLQEAERLERERGVRFLMATVHPDNVYSLRNLEKAGYRCILETEKYGGMRRKVLCKELDISK